jgi:hypothetical protein
MSAACFREFQLALSGHRTPFQPLHDMHSSLSETLSLSLLVISQATAAAQAAKDAAARARTLLASALRYCAVLQRQYIAISIHRYSEHTSESNISAFTLFMTNALHISRPHPPDCLCTTFHLLFDCCFAAAARSRQPRPPCRRRMRALMRPAGRRRRARNASGNWYATFTHSLCLQTNLKPSALLEVFITLSCLEFETNISQPVFLQIPSCLVRPITSNTIYILLQTKQN